ncbi:hypothetical protein BDZ89DRAFT_993485 [Hymenopellis radicata]|nr:hypothetical protein BDZ89DRAFT_993485 [Hymenopellis radicata]
MKRFQSTATQTESSGIFNSRTELYRPISPVTAAPTIDYWMIFKTHSEELSKYLAAYLAQAPSNSRPTARQSLTRITIQQFHELSTDVYDELLRRQNENEVPFLPREELHPMRNQARQKLATLPTSRFEDLSSDVYYELLRRYPEFQEDVPAVPLIDYRMVFKTHSGELSKYLAAYLAKAPSNSRSSARQSLTRLTIQQFHELSTDVYDELLRRQDENEVPFLPREEFHPLRNLARQKFATLPTSCFKDISSDVYYELLRRYPEFKEDVSPLMHLSRL